MNDDKRVLIAGAGLGGLSAALAVRKLGFDPIVFEKAPRLLPFGAVLQLWPHGVQGLRAFGVADEALKESGWIKRVELRDRKEKVLLGMSLEDVPDSVVLSRPHLHETLARAVGDDHIRTTTQVVSFEQDESGVTARLGDDTEERGRILIAADGLESTLREQIAGPVKMRHVGKGWAGVSSVDDPPIELSVTWQILGPGQRVGLTHMKPGVIPWNTVLKVPEDVDIGGKKEALEAFRGWPAPVEAAIDAMPEDDFFARSIRDFEPITKWGEGRVTLLGDAAHATTPAQGRGVSEAIEDAIVLANLLGRVGDLSDNARTVAALRTYERRRQPSTKKVTEGSRRVMVMSLLSNPVKIAGRNFIFRVAGPRMAKTIFEDARTTIEPLEVEKAASPAATAAAD
jgi:2-polyprenyl-6-methoxyphenol hydroxylase-like FAD-dependent oxidoreductase